MKKLFFLFILTIGCYHCFSQTIQSGIWNTPDAAIIIDPFWQNSIDFDLIQKDKKLIAIIHKATEGKWTDKLYKKRRDTAKNLGYKWGSYHLGRPGDPKQQAKHYLNVVGNNADEVYALDLEDDDSTKWMSLNAAKIFILEVKKTVGRYPLIYCNGHVARVISKRYGKDSVFSKCKLWLGNPGEKIGDIKSKTWTSITLWQFSTEQNCPGDGKCLHNIPGVKCDMDINVYNGTKEQLLGLWPNL